MSVTSIRIEGVESTIKELRKTDTAIYNETIKSIKTEMVRAQGVARAGYPIKPLSNWRSGELKRPTASRSKKPFPPYDVRAARASVEVIVGKKSSKSKTSWKVAALRQKDAGGVVFDMAGSATGGKGKSGPVFIGLMNANFSRASRVMWPAVKLSQPAIVKSIDTATKKAATYLNAALSNRKVF